jgi:hypothetical protein
MSVEADDRPLDDQLRHLHDQCRDALASPGDWLTGAERVAVWAEVRDSRTNELDRARRSAVSPNAVDGTHRATAELPAAAVEVAHRVASDPGRLTRSWAEPVLSELGEERYTEIVGVVAIAETLDRFALAMGREPDPLPEPRAGEPARVRPDDVGDVGAWVAQTVEKTRANVSRALSLVPSTNRTWRSLVDAQYSHGTAFYDLHWQRPLRRPQVELVAGRTTSLLECFY